MKEPNYKQNKTCEYCQRSISSMLEEQRFCSLRCRRRFTNSSAKQAPGIKAKTGAANELRICADLLDKGFEVFRNVAATGVDLIAYKDGKATRIEVKTTALRSNGELHVPTLRPQQPCEVLAVIHNGQVRYHDPLTKLPVCL